MVPTAIKVHRETRRVEITWGDAAPVGIPFRLLRGRCPCAGCVDENTGVRTFDVTDAAEDVAPTNVGFSGNYALRVAWSDGHDTGLFTWEWLARIAEEAKASHSM